MTYSKSNTAYLHNQILTASPKKLIEILIESAIKHLKLANHYIDKKDIQEVNKQLIKAQEIVMELKLSINPDVQGDVPVQLSKMYDFMFNQLIQANLSKDKEKILLVQQMLEELLETWVQL
jgi:flagellar protein FliS